MFEDTDIISENTTYFGAYNYFEPVYRKLASSTEWNKLSDDERAEALFKEYEDWVSEPDSNRQDMFHHLSKGEKLIAMKQVLSGIKAWDQNKSRLDEV